VTVSATVPRRGPFAALARVPAAIPVAAIVAFSALVQLRFGRVIPVPWIVPDELYYAELARSIGDGGLPALAGDATFGYGVLYPLLLAPVYALASDQESAYAAAKALNAVLMSLAAVPAYLLARRFVSRGNALLVALLSVALPSLAYASVLMTENAFYPVFLLAMLAVVRALDRPSAGRQLAVLGAAGLLATVRPQGGAVLGAYSGSVLLLAWLRRRAGLPGGLAAFKVTWLAFGAIGLTVIAALLARGSAVLGPYASAVGDLELAEVPRWVWLHLAGLDLYLAVVPALATTVVVARGLTRTARARDRLLAAVVVPATAVTVGLVSVYATAVDLNGREVLNERNLFFLAPLYLIGLLRWIELGLPRSPAVVATAVGLAVLPATIPFSHLAYNVRFQALALVPWSESKLEGSAVWIVVLALSLALATLGLVAARRAALALVAVLWLAFLVVGGFARLSMERAAAWTERVGAGSPPGWVDRAVPTGDVVGLWLRPGIQPRVLQLAQVFNARVESVLTVGEEPGLFVGEQAASLGADGTVRVGGVPAAVPLVLVPCPLDVQGWVVARDAATGALLVRTAGTVTLIGKDRRCPAS